MGRIKGSYIDKPGNDSLISREGINDEPDWHEAFEEKMEDAGWSLKHEVVRNDGEQRADFLGYHDSLNGSYNTGRWVGFELKYSDHKRRTRAGSIARQIEERYLNGSWLSSGEDVDLWVVAPYVEDSHTGDRQEMIAARNRELEASRLLTRAGFGYLHSWHPIPQIAEGRAIDIEPFPDIGDWVSTYGIPAFSGVVDPFKHTPRIRLERVSERCRAIRSGDGAFIPDRDAMNQVREKYRGGGPDE